MGIWIGLLFGLGCYQCFGVWLSFPRFFSGKKFGEWKEEKKDGLEYQGIRLLAQYLPLSKEGEEQLEKKLEAVGLPVSAREYEAKCMLRGGMCLLLSVLCLWWFPLLSPLVAGLGIALYGKEKQKVEGMLAKKRERIEAELPRLVTTIAESTGYGRDLLGMLESFKKATTIEFAKELDLVTADMRSGGYEAALMRWETRFYSPMLSEVVRGLIALLRGDDGQVYFQMLSYDFKQILWQRRKAKAMKIPGKIRKYSLLMLLCFLLTYLVVLGVEMIDSLSTLF